MSYLATCTFDLKNGSSDDYKNAYADFDKIGLKTAVASSEGKRIVAPTTLTIGEFNATDAGRLRDDLCEKVQRGFRTRGFTAEIFVVVGGDWAWGTRTT
jgi:hypothetical protein